MGVGCLPRGEKRESQALEIRVGDDGLRGLRSPARKQSSMAAAVGFRDRCAAFPACCDSLYSAAEAPPPSGAPGRVKSLGM
jgi:hypothetical protein